MLNWLRLLLLALFSNLALQAICQETLSHDAKVHFFESKIRPLLVERCYKCHGPEEQESELRLDSYVSIRQGGAAGAVVMPGKPEQSLLLTAVTYADADLKMPPDKKLSDRQIADLRKWIEIGAPHPDASGTVVTPNKSVDLKAGRQFWAFQKPIKPAVPSVHDTNRTNTPIDNFILAKLQRHGLDPGQAADKRTIIRRVTFDLLGLPPTPDDVTTFLSDDSPDAFDKLVDRLLGSVRYGERWGRHWLDVARYADSNGLDENIAHGNAWRYRDYVIAAMNDDQPFDEFVVEQLAGDLLPAVEDEELQHRRLIATGFLSLGPKVLAEVDEQKMEMDIVDEQIDTFGRAFLAVTLGCSRCHDHKFDPIRQQDYYALAGIFKSTRTMESFTKIARWNENSIATATELAAKEAHDKQIADQKALLQGVIDKANAALRRNLGAAAAFPQNPEPQYPDETKTELKKLRDGLADLEKSVPQLPTAMGVVDGEIADTQVHIRGSHLTLGETTQRAVPAVFVSSTARRIEKNESGRLALAQWLVSEEHPLTNRVIVNRIWRWHFGKGLVRSTDNFGKLGDRPTNPLLLDWMATDFADTGRSIKRLNRRILLSSTYQLSSDYDETKATADPENLLHWRSNIRRLEAESIRDSLLAVGGLLDFFMGGSILNVDNRAFIFDHTSTDRTSYDTRQRSVYLPVVRNHLYDVFHLFDYSDASVPNGNRPTSTVAPQALFLMNGDLIVQASEGLAHELLLLEGEERRIHQLYKKTSGRDPSKSEVLRARRFLAQFTEAIVNTDETSQRTQQSWSALCQVIFASNEFIHIR